MSFYGVVYRSSRVFIIVNGGPNDRMDILIEINNVKDYMESSATAIVHEYNIQYIYNSLFEGGPPYKTCRLQFTEDKGSVVRASYVYHNEFGQVLHHVDNAYNHDSAMCNARWVLSWERVRKNVPKAIEDYAVKTSRIRLVKENDDEECCAICLEGYQEEDMIGTMVRCQHRYHDECTRSG